MNAIKVAMMAAFLGVSACGRSELERARLAAECAAHGEKAFESYKNDLAGKYGDLTNLDKPLFHYNSRLHTCLMQVGHWSFIRGTGLGPHDLDNDLLNEIIDVYSNQTLISAGHENRHEGNTVKMRPIGTNPFDFEEKAKVLMTQ